MQSLQIEAAVFLCGSHKKNVGQVWAMSNNQNFQIMGNIELPSMAKSSAVCYTVSHDDLIDFANAIIKKTQEAAEQESASQDIQEEYLTRKEVMAILKRCDSTMTKWARTGYLEPVRIGGKYLYRKSDVEKLMKH